MSHGRVVWIATIRGYFKGRNVMKREECVELDMGRMKIRSWKELRQMEDNGTFMGA